jgi:hypothetical protein
LQKSLAYAKIVNQSLDYIYIYVYICIYM